MTKHIEYSKEDRDFAAYLDGQYIGSFKTRLEAETELDRLVFEQLRRAG